MSTSLQSPIITTRGRGFSIEVSESALAAKREAIETAIKVERVTNDAENATAVAAQLRVAELLKAVEKARKAANEPVLEAQRAINGAAKQFCAGLQQEAGRLGKLTGDYRQLEDAKRRAAENAAKADLADLERDRQEALAKAQTHEELDTVNEFYNQRARDIADAPPPVRVEGQMVRHDWEIIVTDVWALANAHRGCVNIEARLSEIKALLRAGVKVAGIHATPVTTGTVRTGNRVLIEA